MDFCVTVNRQVLNCSRDWTINEYKQQPKRKNGYYFNGLVQRVRVSPTAFFSQIFTIFVGPNTRCSNKVLVPQNQPHK